MTLPAQAKFTQVGGGGLNMEWDFAAPIGVGAEGFLAIGFTAAQRTALLAANGNRTPDLTLLEAGGQALISAWLQNVSGTLTWMWSSQYYSISATAGTTLHTEADQWHSLRVANDNGGGGGVFADVDSHFIGNHLAGGGPNTKGIQIGQHAGTITNGDYYLFDMRANDDQTDPAGILQFWEVFGTEDFSQWDVASASGGATLAVVDWEFVAATGYFSDNFDSGMGFDATWDYILGGPAISATHAKSAPDSVKTDSTAGSPCVLGAQFPELPRNSGATCGSWSYTFSAYIVDWSTFWDGGTYWGPFLGGPLETNFDEFNAPGGAYLDPTSPTTGNIGCGGYPSFVSQAVSAGAFHDVTVWYWQSAGTGFLTPPFYYDSKAAFLVWVDGVLLSPGTPIPGTTDYCFNSNAGIQPDVIGIGDDGGYGVMPAANVFWVDNFAFQEGPPAAFAAPDPVITLAATDIKATSMTLHGTVNPEGVDSTGYFEYGTTISYGASTSRQFVGSGSAPVAVEQNLSNLSPSTTYHFRMARSAYTPPSVISRPYRDDSWVNTPVDPNDAHVMFRSNDVVTWMVNVAPLGYHFSPGANGGPAMYVADSNTPRVTVQQNLSGPVTGPTGGYWTDVPIDPSWRPGSYGLAGIEAEPDMVIFDSDTGDEWFFYKCTPPGDPPYDWGTANQYWQARGVGKTTGTGEPGGWQGTGGNGTSSVTTYQDGGENAGTGKIRAWETNYPDGSDWGHALACSAPRVCNAFVYPSSNVSSSVTYPVSNLTAVPSGTRYWLPPTYDIENAICDWPNNTFGTSGTWFGQPLQEIDKQLLRTFAKYGCYICDQNGSPSLPNDNSVGIGTEGLYAPHLRGETFAWESGGVMYPFWPRLPRSAVAALKITTFQTEPGFSP